MLIELLKYNGIEYAKPKAWTENAPSGWCDKRKILYRSVIITGFLGMSVIEFILDGGKIKKFKCLR